MEYINGSIAGAVGCFASYPIDTLRIRIQNNATNIHKTSLLKYNNLFKNVKDLYSGVSSTMFGMAVEKAIVFGSYTFYKKNIPQIQNFIFGKSSNSEIFNTVLAGFLSGTTCSIIVSPYEKLKILMQMNEGKKYNEYINRKNINFKYVFNGLSATVYRESPGFGIYFLTYEMLKNKTFTEKNKQITKPMSMLYGGISGAMAWLFIYPIDRVKTYMQTYNTNLVLAFNNTIKKENIFQIYKGFSMTLMRAFILHAAVFSTYEAITF